jgi:hypothetical protein
VKLLREPLVHFLLLGAALFLLFELAGDPEPGEAGQIVVTSGRIRQLAQGWARTWQRPPTPEELEGLIEEYIKEEVYYREALAMGLDRDDLIIRRRMRQKLEFLTDDVVDSVAPEEEELRAYFDDHVETYRDPTRVSFEQVYLSRERRGDDAEEDAERLISQLNSGSPGLNPATLGDPFLLPGSFDDASTSEVDRQLGDGFSARMMELPLGRWAGPVESGYGLHVVRVAAWEESGDSVFEDVRDAVERDWQEARRKAAAAAFYRKLRERYTVTVEWD